MAEQILDGAGLNYRAKVDSTQRLHTLATTLTEQDHANDEGDAYNINTGIITLTNDAETPVLYFKNNEDNHIHISAIAAGFGATDGTAGDPAKITIIRNPTAGTITSGSDVDINSNRNFGSQNTLTVDAKKGATGSTMTDGVDHVILYQTLSGRLFASISEVIPKGSSIGIKIDPNTTGNSSLTVYAALILYLGEDG